MTPVKIIALVFIVFALVKLLVICIDPASWKSVIKTIYTKPIYTTVFSLIAALVILKFFLQEMTIVQVFASMTFMMALMMAQFAVLGKEIIELSERFFSDRSIMKKLWLPISIWIALIAWALYEIFV
ncbi:MAG: hypothetical protein KAR32_03245 [Candidatus Omnitrophica bacterium]|nr:hypothetical protein [Candidatus Omnitrophota bacterium]